MHPFKNHSLIYTFLSRATSAHSSLKLDSVTDMLIFPGITAGLGAIGEGKELGLCTHDAVGFGFVCGGFDFAFDDGGKC